MITKEGFVQCAGYYPLKAHKHNHKNTDKKHMVQIEM